MRKEDQKMANENDIGLIILQQMGSAARIARMIGASFARVENGIGIKWPSRQPSKGNYVEIVLEPSDTYKMTFYNLRGGSKKVVREVDDVYFDMLIDIFEKQTGYYLHF
jgi:hypothetical protein